MDTSQVTNIFLIIAAASVIFLALIVSVLIINIILLLRSLRLMANKAEQAAKMVSEDLVEFSQKIKKEGFSLKLLLKFIFELLSFKSSKKINKK